MESVCKPRFEKKLPCNTDAKGNDSRTKLLYNEDCENKKIDFLNRLNILGSVRMIHTELKWSQQEQNINVRLETIDLNAENIKQDNFWI